MKGNLWRRLLTIFTGALLGYVWGWIWGWSLYDPNSDIWALAAGLGAVIGLLLGVVLDVQPSAPIILCATFGLYLSWLGRTLIFGDVAGGPGILLLISGSLIGVAIGLYSRRHAAAGLVPVLVGALYIGFFGGFVIDAILLDRVLGLVRTHSILNQAPAVVACSLIGGWAVARWRRPASPIAT